MEKLTIAEYMEKFNIKSRKTVYNQAKLGLITLEKIDNKNYIIFSNSEELGNKNTNDKGLTDELHTQITQCVKLHTKTEKTSPENTEFKSIVEQLHTQITHCVILEKDLESSQREIEFLKNQLAKNETDKEFFKKQVEDLGERIREQNILSLSDKKTIEQLTQNIKMLEAPKTIWKKLGDFFHF